MNPTLRTLVCFLCAFALSPVPAPATIFINGPAVHSTPAGFTANTAVFDGTNDFITISSTAAGLVDGKAFTCSFWLKLNGGNAAAQQIYTNTSDHVTIQRNTTNIIRVIGMDSSANIRLDLRTTTTLTSSSGWVHVYICVDTAQAQANTKIYLNGVSDTLTYSTFSSASNLDISAASTRIGANISGSNKLNASLAEFWFDDTYHDAPTSFASGGHPISLGSDGSTPFTAAPAFYFSRNGSGDSWAVDSSGNSNTMTVTGALTTDTAP